MIKLLKMIDLYGFWRVMKDPEYYHKKYDWYCEEYKNN